MASLKVRVNAPLVHGLFDQRFGGISNFVDEWANSSLAAEARSQRSVKTVYAWLKHGLPSTKETLFSFCGALDVDPVAIIDFDLSNLRKHFGRFRRAIMLSGLNVGGFGPLVDFYRPSAGWPDNGHAQRYFGRDWTVFHIDHPAETILNTYATITVSGDPSEPAAWPRAYHIAYRRRSNADGLWRPYGSVILRQNEAILAHENGDIQRQPILAHSEHRLRFQTFFGPSPAEFRLACLHPFSGSVAPYPDPTAPLRFVG